MSKFFVTIILMISTIILSENTVHGQTVIKEKTFKLSKKNYCSCEAGNWNMKIPKLSNITRTDIRSRINDSITKIVNLIYADTITYSDSNIESGNCDCDTTSVSFSPSECNVHYRIGQNSAKILSLDMNVDWSAGGGGNGFSTDYYSFAIDIANNRMVFIHDLFDETNTEKLKKYLSEKEVSLNEIPMDEDFNIFGTSEDYPQYGSYEYAGFIIDNNKNLILSYSWSYGRGNGIIELSIPLADIKSFINKKYLWLY